MRAIESIGRKRATRINADPIARPSVRLISGLISGLIACLASVQAASPGPITKPAARQSPASSSAVVADLARWLERQVELPDGQGLRIEVRIGRLPRALTLPDCTRAEPFLPPNAKLWGRANIGLRCVEGGSWKTWIPVTVSAWGPAVVARRNLAPGQPIPPDAIETREIDWAAGPRPPIADPRELAGKELLRPVPAGRPLLADHLRATPTVRLGEAVPLTLTGSGFTIRVIATALASGADGQRISVRTPTGKVLSGTIEGTSVLVTR